MALAGCASGACTGRHGRVAKGQRRSQQVEAAGQADTAHLLCGCCWRRQHPQAGGEGRAHRRRAARSGDHARRLCRAARMVALKVLLLQLCRCCTGGLGELSGCGGPRGHSARGVKDACCLPKGTAALLGKAQQCMKSARPHPPPFDLSALLAKMHPTFAGLRGGHAASKADRVARHASKTCTASCSMHARRLRAQAGVLRGRHRRCQHQMQHGLAQLHSSQGQGITTIITTSSPKRDRQVRARISGTAYSRCGEFTR